MDRFRGNGSYGKIPTEKEPITTLGFTALPYNNNLFLTERESRTGEYWPDVVTGEVRTKTTGGQYSPVGLKQARLVSSLLYGSWLIPFRSVKFKGLPARGDASNLERISYRAHDFAKKKLLTSS